MTDTRYYIVEFGPVDVLNPMLGYSIKITSCRGEVLIDTSSENENPPRLQILL